VYPLAHISLRLLALIALAGASSSAGAPLDAAKAAQSAVFASSTTQVRKAAEDALRDAHYSVSDSRDGRVVSGLWRRTTGSRMKEQAAAIEELRRISRYDPVDVPDTRALAEYRVSVQIEINEAGEGKTRIDIHAEILTVSRIREGDRVDTKRVAFPSLGVVEEETLLRIRAHLGEAPAP
jgi:hypothetical protein